MASKPTYQELVNQIAELKKQNEVFQLNYSSQEVKNNFQALYDNSPDMYVSVSADDASILQCKEAFLTNTAYSEEEIDLGNPPSRIGEDWVILLSKII